MNTAPGCRRTSRAVIWNMMSSTHTQNPFTIQFVQSIIRGVGGRLQASSMGVGVVKSLHPPTHSIPFLYLPTSPPAPTVAHSVTPPRPPPPLTRAAPSLQSHAGIWTRRCVRSGPRESVCCGRCWSLWCPAACRSWPRWSRRGWIPSPACWSRRLWSPSWLATRRTVCHTTWAASRGWSTPRSA